MGETIAFSDGAGRGGGYGVRAVGSVLAFSVFAMFFRADIFLSRGGLVAESIFAAGCLAGSALTPAAVAAFSFGFVASLGDVETAESEDFASIGVPSGLTKPLWTGTGGGVCEAVNTLAAAVAKAGA